MTTRHNPGDTVYIRYMPPYGSARITKHVIAKVTKTGYTLTDGSRVAFDGHNKSTRLIGWATAEQVDAVKAAAALEALRAAVIRIVNSADAATLNRALDAMRAPAVTLPDP
jgi:hypothetical protein